MLSGPSPSPPLDCARRRRSIVPVASSPLTPTVAASPLTPTVALSASLSASPRRRRPIAPAAITVAPTAAQLEFVAMSRAGKLFGGKEDVFFAWGLLLNLVIMVYIPRDDWFPLYQ